MSARRVVANLAFLLLAVCFCLHLGAQENTATLTGVVTDPSGAAIPNVTVTLTNPQTDSTYKTVSNGAGSYTFTEVKPGPGYNLIFEAQGFEKEAVADLYLNIAATRIQNAQMRVGQTQETVTVSAANQTVTLDTTDATVGNNFQVQYLNDLPIEDRSNPSALFTQQPGITLDGAATGARVDQDRVTLDGLDVNDLATGEFGVIVANAPVDSVQEFRGMVAGALSTSGPGGGGQFDLVTKSGTNAFHGDANEYHRDTDLEANSWFNNNAGVGRAPLIRNQFGGGVGGPIWHDRAFFYFDYNGRRDTLSNAVNQTVPLDSYRNQIITYCNNTSTAQSCNASTLSAAQAASLDPQGVGWNQNLVSVLNSRYPHANNAQVGDGLNTGGFQFNAPFPYTENDFVGRVDYNLTQKMKIDGVGHWTRTNGTESAIQFPGDPETHPFLDQSYSWVVGHTWTISGNKINQFYGGEVQEDYSFPNSYNPTGATQWQTFGGNGTGGAILTSPYGSAINAQGRTYPIPMIRDNFTWIKGNHSITFGGTFKWPDPLDYTILNYNTPTLGLGGHTTSLAVPTGTPSLRPSDIGSGNATALYDSAYALALAPITATDATFYYNSSLSPIPQGTAQTHRYKYKELEGYVSDTWKVTPTLTVTYGLQWQFFGVPYDSSGIEAVPQFVGGSQKFNFQNYFDDRVAQSKQGISGNLTVPLIQYVLGGKANHGPNYYQPQYDNFAPKFAFAWNPSFDRKTVWSGGANLVYDQTVVNAVQYQESQYSYLFQASNPTNFGTVGNAYASLQADSRFGGFNAPPPPPAAPTITLPYLPYVQGTGASAVPYGLADGAFNETIDPQLKTPYSISYNFGWQHQFPQGYLLRTMYAGRLGRRLLAQVDASQLIDFPDSKSGQTMAQAFSNISLEVRNGQPVTTQPWYEDVLPAGSGAAYGFPNNTQLVAYGAGAYVPRGDFADTTALLAGAGVLPPNIGMDAQFAENTFYTNQGMSAYNGLLTTLHKNVGYGLQFDVNYTWSHSIDNVSVVANAPAIGGYGFICDEIRPRECRANSDFNVSNNLTGNVLYALPVGRGQAIAGNAPYWLNEAIGGWEISGLPSWHTGNVYFAGANAFVAGYANNAAAILTSGSTADMKVHLTGGKGQPLFAFPNHEAVRSEYTGPIGFTIGSRNNLYGPRFFDLDLGLGKTFPLYKERVNLKFRADAFNATNHVNFANPNADITEANQPFGLISGTTTNDLYNPGENPRVLQGALRVEF